MIRLSWCRWSLLALIPVQLIWFIWLQPPQILPLALVLALSILPLLLVLPFAWRLKPRGLVVAGLFLLVYFSVGVTEAWVNPNVRLIALVQVGLVVIYFTALATIRRQPSTSA